MYLWGSGADTVCIYLFCGDGLILSHLLCRVCVHGHNEFTESTCVLVGCFFSLVACM